MNHPDSIWSYLCKQYKYH